MAVIFKATSDFEDVVKDYERLQRQNLKLQERIRGVTTAGADGKQQSDSFAASQFASIRSMVTGWASVEGAVRLVGSALQFAQEETNAAIGSMDMLADSRRRLAQVSLGGKDLDAIDKRADQLAQEYGVDREAARNVVFDARSLGVDEALPQIFKYSPVLDPGTATAAAGKLPSIFKGQVNQEQSLNLAFAAARESALSFEDLMQSLPTAAQGVSLAGGSPTEAAAIVSVLSEEMADKAEAGRLAKSFGVKVGIDRERFSDKNGILQAVEQLEQMSPESRGDFLKESQELNVAYQKISANMAKIRERQATIQNAVDTAGTVESPLEQARLAVFDPNTDLGKQNLANMERRKAAIRRETVREDRFAESGARADAARDTVVADLDLVHANPITKYAGVAAAETGKFLGLEGSEVDRTSLIGAEMGEKLLRRSLMPFIPPALFDPFQKTSAEKVADLRDERNLAPGEGETVRVQERGNGILSEIRDGIQALVSVQNTAVGNASHRETR